MSPIWGDAPSNPTATNFCMWGLSPDVINYVTFYVYPRSSFYRARPLKFSSPIDLKCDLYNSWSSTELRCDQVWIPYCVNIPVLIWRAKWKLVLSGGIFYFEPSYMYVFKVLRSHGLNDATLLEIYRAVVLVKLLYASSGTWRFHFTIN